MTVTKTWKEGLLMKKVCFTCKNRCKGEQTFKFGVFNTKNWLKTIDESRLTIIEINNLL